MSLGDRSSGHGNVTTLFQQKLSHLLIDKFFVFDEAIMVSLRDFHDLCLWDIAAKKVDAFPLNWHPDGPVEFSG